MTNKPTSHLKEIYDELEGIADKVIQGLPGYENHYIEENEEYA